jgi:hypothetical protein
MARVAKEVITTLNSEIATHQRTQPSIALEAIFVRDEIRAAGGEPAEGELSALRSGRKLARLGSVLEQMPAAKHRRALQSFKRAAPRSGPTRSCRRSITFPPSWPGKWRTP